VDIVAWNRKVSASKQREDKPGWFRGQVPRAVDGSSIQNEGAKSDNLNLCCHDLYVRLGVLVLIAE
jgi:hypothetical protein